MLDVAVVETWVPRPAVDLQASETDLACAAMAGADAAEPSNTIFPHATVRFLKNAAPFRRRTAVRCRSRQAIPCKESPNTFVDNDFDAQRHNAEGNPWGNSEWCEYHWSATDGGVYRCRME